MYLLVERVLLMFVKARVGESPNQRVSIVRFMRERTVLR